MSRKFLCLLIIFIATQKIFAQNNIGFNWLVGKWKVNFGKGYIFEEWKKKNDSSYFGYSAYVQGKDSMVEETIELIKVKNKWIFTPTTANQNDRKPVDFTVIFFSKDEFICENIKHDYPSRISYRFYNNQLLASIEGKKKGKFKKSNFDYVKVD